MEITKRQHAEGLEIAIAGRLDAYWADHLGAAIEDSLKAGAHHLRVDMANVSYMSSAGIRVLLRFHKQVQQLSGSFVVINPYPAVHGVLQMVGLEALLTGAAAPAPASAASQRLISGEIQFEVVGPTPAVARECRMIGDPAGLLSSAEN